jgi:hypothetical protein
MRESISASDNNIIIMLYLNTSRGALSDIKHKAIARVVLYAKKVKVVLIFG